MTCPVARTVCPGAGLPWGPSHRRWPGRRWALRDKPQCRTLARNGVVASSSECRLLSHG